MKTKPKMKKKNRLPNWVIVALVLIGSVLLTWMLSAARLAGQVQKDREGFQKAEAAAAATIDELSSLLGEPLYVDTRNLCYMRAPEKFANEILFCHTKSVAYFQLDGDPSDGTIRSTMKIIETSYSTPLEQVSYENESGYNEYVNISSTAKQMNGLSCSMGIKYPSNDWESPDLPKRTFAKNVSILSVFSDCGMNVSKAIY